MTGALATPGLPREAADLLAAAKLWLISAPVAGGGRTGDMPYLAVALYALVPLATERVQRMATDPAWRLYVNIGWLTHPDRTVPEVGHELAHQVWHLLADHAGRAADLGVTAATSRAWRVAADVTVHEVLGGLPDPFARRPPGASAPHAGAGTRGGSRTPAHVLAARAAALSDDHALVAASTLGLRPGRAAEEYFAVLSDLPVLPSGGGGGAGDDPSAGDPSPDPSCGSGCDGIPRGHDLPDRADDGGLDAVAADAIRRVVATEFSQRGQGSIPGEWARWVQRVLEPVVDWRTVLHAAVRRGLGWAHGHTDYTYTRISRRQAVAGPVILPALRRPVPRVAIVVDTSGSVDDGLLAQALGEVDGVLGALGVADPQVTVLAVDAAVHAVSTVRRAESVQLGGGGGTDMALGIEAALQVRPRVDVVVVCTDGLTGWPSLPAPVPVVAVLIGRAREELGSTPDWIHRVECVP